MYTNVVEKSDIIISSKCYLFSPWYSWKIAHLALNNQHTLYAKLNTTVLPNLSTINEYVVEGHAFKEYSSKVSFLNGSVITEK